MEFKNNPPKSIEELKLFCGAYSLPKEELPEEKLGREERGEEPPKNQDSFLIHQKNSFAVCDGVGGLDGGDIASARVIEGLSKIESLTKGLSLEDRIKKIKEIFIETNNLIFNMGLKIGTTASFTQVIEGSDGKRKLITANVGDSRVYVLRKDGILDQVTTDDNKHISRELQLKFNNVKDINELSPEEIKLWWKRHFISNMLGLPEDKFNPKITITDLSDDDTVIITSDGIHDNLTSEEIANIVAGQGNNNQKAKSLVEAARARSWEGTIRSKRDDMTALIISAEQGK